MNNTLRNLNQTSCNLAKCLRILMALTHVSVSENEVLGKNDKNLNNFGVATDVLFVTGRSVLWVERNLITYSTLSLWKVN